MPYFLFKNYYYKTKNAKHYSMKLLLKNLKLIEKKDKQLHRLGLFVASTYHNKGETIVIDLFDVITKNHPNYELSKEEIFAKIWTEKDYNDRAFSVYASKLNDLVEEFFIQEELKNDPFLKQSLLAKAYARKEDFHLFNSAQKKAKSEIKKESSISAYQQATLGIEAIFHIENKNLEDDTLLKDTLLNVERVSLLEQLKLHAELLSRTQILANNEQSSLNLLLNQVYIEDYFQFLPIEIYVKTLQFSIQNDTPKYSETVDLFTKNVHLFSNIEQLQLFSLVQNFNIRQINSGQKREKEMNEFYLMGIQLGIFQEGRAMSESTFLNIANNFSILHEFEKHKQFVSKFTKSLPKENREIVLTLAKVNFYFYQFENTKSTHFLGDIQLIARKIDSISGKLMYNLLLRMSLCKTYYELLLIDNLMLQLIESEIIAFKSFIKRKKISEEKIALYANFFSILSELIKITYKPNANEKARLRERCNTVSPLGNRAYLLRKIESL